MRHSLVVVVFTALILLALPLAAGALGLDVEANAGAGIGLGSTSNPNETGAPRFAFQGGLEADLFLISLGPVDLGISTGLEYTNLTVNSVIKGSFITSTGDYNFVYLIVPFGLTSRIPLTPDINLSLRAGGFLGHFMGGQASNITYSPSYPGPTTVTLDSSTTLIGSLGLHFSAGADIRLTGNLFLSPSIIFNYGLTNTTATSGYQYSDTLASLTGMIGLKYNIL